MREVMASVRWMTLFAVPAWYHDVPTALCAHVHAPAVSNGLPNFHEELQLVISADLRRHDRVQEGPLHAKAIASTRASCAGCHGFVHP